MMNILIELNDRSKLQAFVSDGGVIEDNSSLKDYLQTKFDNKEYTVIESVQIEIADAEMMVSNLKKVM